ncbi:hypothetical protein EDC94DRAFT_560027 [Helicostylum pulchrum]|nr:hypothetical protein EDC94DRAFT_560027 [Helicostylum pulchrum]
MNPNQLPTDDPVMKTIKDDEENESAEESDVKPTRRSGRRKIKIEYIEDKNRRHITFSKRKAGIMKKAYELSTLTGTQVLLLVVSETGLVYTFTTVKLQPIVTKPEGKNLIQACLNAPDPVQSDSNENETSTYPGNGQSRVDIDKKPIVYEEKKVEVIPAPAPVTTTTTTPTTSVATPATQTGYNASVVNPNTSPYQQQPYGTNAPPPPQPPTTSSQMPPMGTNNYGHPGYMNPTYQQGQPQQQSPQQQQQQQPYGQMPGPPFYGNQQQQHYMQQQQQHPGYWPNNNNPSSPALRQQEEEKARRGLAPNNKK